MYTLDEINNEVDKYIKHTGNNIPYIQNVKYNDMGDTHGEVKGSDLIQNNYTLYLNPNNDKYLPVYQKSILWHEFTHIYDFINNTNKTEREYYMPSVSEINSHEIQVRYLAGINLSDYITLYKKIPYMYWTRTYTQILNYFFVMTEKCIIEYEKSKNPKDFMSAFHNVMYACGTTKLIRYGDEHFIKHIQNVVEPYKSIFIQIVKDLYNNNGKEIPLLFCDIKTQVHIGNMKEFINTYKGDEIYVN